MSNNLCAMEVVEEKDYTLKKESEKQLRKEKRKQEKMIAEEQSLEKAKQKALKGMKYLLGLSEKYLTFFQDKISVENGKTKSQEKKKKYQPTLKDVEDAAKLENNNSGVERDTDVNNHLKYFEGGQLRDYQHRGVTWMRLLFENALNGILADEMGLGKTIQVIALICHLLEKEIPGPYLIICPLSTISNWEVEFKRFAPKIPVVVFHGNELERRDTYSKILKQYDVEGFLTRPVVVTNYEMSMHERRFLERFEWQYIIIDEGHRIKNHKTKLAQTLRSMNSLNRLILTGTPLQNNITELWALLNFLLPHIFNNMDTFASLFMLEDMQDENKLLEQEEKNNLISTIHRVLAPFMLRRLKADVLTDLVPKKEVLVYCPISKLQRDLYSYVITKNLDQLLRKEEEEIADILEKPKKKRKCTLGKKRYTLSEEKSDDSDFEDQLLAEVEEILEEKVEKKIVPFITRLTMSNPVMMFKKIVDHPYLVHFPLDPECEERTLLVDENIVKASGKMTVLDFMLPALRKNGHKVLIFSTLTMVLDIIEDYLLMRNYTYRRLDGSMRLDTRQANITEFNQNPEIFVFLISTRAGGLGLNLTGADTVIFFDRDWNPQADIQAQDRCHRIGQSKPVMVYTLVTRNTIDEKIITRGQQKRLLEKIVIKDGKFKMNQQDRVLVADELKELLKLLEQENSNCRNGYLFSKRELHKLLDRSELYELMKQKEQGKEKK